MNDCVGQYRKALRKHLRCGWKSRKRLLMEFDKTLGDYLEEHDAPTLDDLNSAFGSPEEMAEIMMAGLTSQEQAQYQKLRFLQKVGAWVLVVIALMSAVYIWLLKEFSITVVDNAGVIDETTEPIAYTDVGVDFI